jgi:hypothetical protein
MFSLFNETLKIIYLPAVIMLWHEDQPEGPEEVQRTEHQTVTGFRKP